MADYHSILTKTISGLSTNTPELRQAVYAKARNAIESRLRRLDPPPGEAEIVGQLKLLEEAIVAIEADHALAATASPAPVVTEDPATVATERAEPVAPDVTAAPAVAQPPEPPAAATVQPPATTQTPADDDDLVVVAPSEPEADVPVEPEVAQVAAEPSKEPAAATEAPTVASIPEDGIPEELIKKAGPKKKLPLAGILTTLVVLGIVGGVGYAGWAYRDSISGMVAGLMPAEEAETAERSPVVESEAEVQLDADPDAGTESKENVRLGADGQEAVGEPLIEPSTEESAGLQEPSLLGDGGAELEAELETPTEGTAEQVTPEAEQPAPEEAAAEPAEEAVDETQSQASDAAISAPLGEVAYLYEEGAAGAGATRSNASVTWSLVNLKPSASMPEEPAIVARMDVPDNGLAVDINIKRNVDEALSASHIIEISFDVPASFPGGSIDNIARFVMKQSEEARGEPLVAVPVKVSDGYFLVALDNLEQARQVNTQLMQTSGWIDIPITYTSGKRALLTLEKGGSGSTVFTDAFADWETR